MKKRINIVLLIFVVGLWSTIIYRYVTSLSIKNNSLSDFQDIVNNDKFNLKEKDTFELRLIDRDPFLNKNFNKVQSYSTINHKNISTKKNIPKSIYTISSFPSLNYLGYIKSQNNKNELVLIKVNNKLIKYRINEFKEGIKVISINKDSIQILFNNKRKIIKRDEI